MIILETIIALTFSFFVLSIFVSGIYEATEMMINRRGQNLKALLKRTFSSYNDELLEQFYKHPLISSLSDNSKIGFLRKLLFKIIYKTDNNKERLYPSYIPKSIFSAVINDIINTNNDKQRENNKDEQNANSTFSLNTISYYLNDNSDNSSNNLFKNIADNSNNNHEWIDNLELWYDEFSNRITGWYKRKAMKHMFWISFIIVIYYNLDAVKLTKAYYTNDVMRSELVQIAADSSFIQSNGALSKARADSIYTQYFETLLTPIYKQINIEKLQKDSTTKSKIQLYKMALMQYFNPNNWLGWLVMTLAISMGAPFWFDILKKFVNIRGSGEKPT